MTRRCSKVVQYPVLAEPVFVPPVLLESWVQPTQQPVHRQRSNLWRNGQWYFAPLRPQGFTSPSELLPGWQPATVQPVRRQRFVYWDTGAVLVTTPTSVPVAENRLDSWFMPTQQPVRRPEQRPQGWWDGVLVPGIVEEPPRIDHWEPHVSQPIAPRRMPRFDSFFAPQLDYSPSVPSLTSWYRPASEPIRRVKHTPGTFVIGLPDSLLSTLLPCPYRPPFVEDTDPSAPTLAVEDEARPITETEDELRPRTGDCC